MASSLALRGATGGATSLFTRLSVHTRAALIRPAAIPHRSFNTDSQMTTVNEDDRAVDLDRRSDRSVSRRRNESLPTLFSDVFDPFYPTRSLSQMLNLMDQFTDSPFFSGSRGRGAAVGRDWDVKETDDALCLQVDMPGLDKDQVKVSVQQNTLVIKGEGEKESEDDAYGRRYLSRIDLPHNLYKLDGVKAGMKNGVLKVIVPKVEEEEKKDVYQVSVE